MIQEPARADVQEIVVETVPVAVSTLLAAMSRLLPVASRLKPLLADPPPPFDPF
jgi:hypothetical protein